MGGLDTHAGLLWHDGEGLWFLHSTVAEVGEAIKERAGESRVLGHSRYRITGNITADDMAVEAWTT